jgi:putative hemolysin
MLLFASAVVLLLVVLNGLFAMSELAVVSSRRPKLQARAERGERGAQAALRLAEDPTRFLSAGQVGITLIGILAGAFGQATIAGELDARLEQYAFLAEYSEQIATGVVVVVLTYVSLILGELVPKRLALIHPEGIAVVVAGPLSAMARLLGPFVTLLTFSTATILRLLRIRDRDGTAVTQEEVETVLAEGTGAGVIEPQEEAMMHEVMRLGDRPVRVAMTPRTEVYWVTLEDDQAAVGEDIRACPYSRFVLVRGRGFDTPIGVVHKRDVADALLSGEALDLEALAHEPVYIPETTSLLQAMEQFRTARTHMAFVVDEFGSLEGVLTPTDLLEMITGDLPEEHDSGPAGVEPQLDGSYRVDGRLDIVDLNRALGGDFEEDASYHTVAGLLLNALGRLPIPGEKVRLDGFEAEVAAMEERRIESVIFRRI